MLKVTKTILNIRFNFATSGNARTKLAVSNIGLKIGNLTNFIMLFPFLATIWYYHLFL